VALEPGDFVAGYAAVVATAALGWQVWSSYRAKRPQVTLLLGTWRSSQTGNRRTVDSVEVRIRNREEYTIRVERLFFTYPFPAFFYGAPIRAEIESGDVDALPFDVPSREVVRLTLRPSESYGWRLSSGSQPTLVIGMELRTGEQYFSRAASQ
jgi:hypothetical protein